MKKSFTPLEIMSVNRIGKKFLTGFTLIELLIVLVIIGILATIAIPQYNQFKEKAAYAEAKMTLKAWADSVWMYYTESGTWPPYCKSYEGGVPPPNWPPNTDVVPPVSKYWYWSFSQVSRQAVAYAYPQYLNMTYTGVYIQINPDGTRRYGWRKDGTWHDGSEWPI